MDGQAEQGGGPATADRRPGLPQGVSAREAVAGVLLLATIVFAVYSQLFDSSAGLFEPTETANAVRLAVTAGVALVFAALLDPRALLRGLFALPILALALLTALTFLVPAWAQTEPDQVTRLGLLTLGYTGIAASAFVFGRWIGTWSIVVLVAVTATVAGGMGLWGYAEVESILAGVNQGDFVPLGPLDYRNALALLSAAALVPLGRWALPLGRSATGAAVSVAAGLALGVQAIVIGVALSEFAILFSFLLAVGVLIWPGPALGIPARKALPPLLAAGLVALSAWILYRQVLPLPPEPDGTRLTVMLFLIGLTPALVWGFTPLIDRIPERYAGRAGYGLIGFAALAALVVAIGPGLPTGSADVRVRYYEVIVDLLYDEPVAGVGPGNYFQNAFSSQLQLLGTNTRFAHSIPGEAWVELGLAGLLASLLLYVGAFRDGWRARRVRSAALLAPLVLGFLLSGLIDWSWHIPAMTALWAAALGSVAGVAEAGPRTETEAGPPGRVSSAR